MTKSLDDPRLLPLLGGLVEVANAGCADVELFERMCTGVRDAGVPLVRSALQMENLHPVYYGYCLHWQEGGPAHLLERSRAFGASEEFALSPYMASLTQGGWRWRQADGAVPELPLVRGLAETGITDFMAEIIGSVGTLPPGITWATRASDGFPEADVAFLRALGPHLVPPFGVGAERRKLDAVLRTYLGTAPGREVLGGHIQRGDVRRLEAVVLLTDLRGFTALTARMAEAELLATLDRYFETVADAVQAHGGEVLKFIGDGVLAVFAADPASGLRGGRGRPRRACHPRPALHRRAHHRTRRLRQHRRAGTARLHRDRGRRKPGQPCRGRGQATGGSRWLRRPRSPWPPARRGAASAGMTCVV